MLCPLFRVTKTTKDGEVEWHLSDCLKEECAWWNETQGMCAVKDLAQQLGYISSDLTQISESMPTRMA